MNVKNFVIAILLLVIAGAVGYFIIYNSNTSVTNEDIITIATTTSSQEDDVATTTTEITEIARDDETIIGMSDDNANIMAYHFGAGEKEILFIGGIHGGYSWNTSLVSYELIDYLKANPTLIPDNLTITIIPTLNPDGLKSTIGTSERFTSADTENVSEVARIAGRFNTNKVDLNRNFDCDWKEKSMWQSREVSGGSKPFSEPEAVAMRDYISKQNPIAVIVWFSAEGKVYPAACGEKPSEESIKLAATFAQAADYGVSAEFDAYTINGDMVNWIASQEIPAISVLLTDHKNTEWDKNRAGFEAVVKAYTE